MALLTQKVAADGADQNSLLVLAKTNEKTVMELERRHANEDKILLSGSDMSAKSRKNIVNLLQT